MLRSDQAPGNKCVRRWLLCVEELALPIGLATARAVCGVHVPSGHCDSMSMDDCGESGPDIKKRVRLMSIGRCFILSMCSMLYCHCPTPGAVFLVLANHSRTQNCHVSPLELFGPELAVI